jgi:DNA repair protein RecO (recombination protein O)
MLQKTRGIVLNNIKYGEKSLITTIYTELSGRKSFLVQHVFGKRSGFHSSFFQPLTLLNIQVDQKPNRNLQRIREVTLIQPFFSIPYNASKRSITLFLAEILLKAIKEEEANTGLFQFLCTSIELLDIKSTAISNFHLVFLINLSKYLGIYPADNYSEENCLFDIVNGNFNSRVTKTGLNDRDISFIIHKLINTNYSDMETLQLGHQSRLIVLQVIIDYFNMHLDGIGEIKSLSVLQAIFGN